MTLMGTPVSLTSHLLMLPTGRRSLISFIKHPKAGSFPTPATCMSDTPEYSEEKQSPVTYHGGSWTRPEIMIVTEAISASPWYRTFFGCQVTNCGNDILAHYLCYTQCWILWHFQLFHVGSRFHHSVRACTWPIRHYDLPLCFSCIGSPCFVGL